ncbi:SDR family NAD(P)-dependent oxidoreductase [Lewinella sp. JB7]|uniref:SDR family NAD(P)-dependent oxidoreductase n=1 Tax=Lewinella sp. JB7 TaxID=2962887 RepID=UPI0020C9B621|nr:SDR family oxidoreductase [Lewinella sp. JB7]MCP9236309.1 SDR family oxidoreductase [Lewinella sp. JB7]
MDLKINNRKALITGAAGGMGEATARLLLDEGVRLVLTDIDADGLQETARRLGGGDRLTTVVADLTRESGVQSVADAAGDIDILVHTTGVTGAKGDPLEDVNIDDYREAFEIDFLTGVQMARSFVPGMRKRGWGRVVFVTSENVAQPYPDEAVYNAAKAALLTFVKGTAQLYAIDGVCINSVAPAFIETGMTDGMMDKRAEKLGMTKDEAINTFLNESRPHLVLHRRGKAEEVAAVIAFLCSELASFVIGSNYRVDGGSVQSIEL